MANEQNLRPQPFTSESGRENQKKSVQKRKQNTTIRESFKLILSEPVTDSKQLSLIKKSGLPVGDKPTYMDYICASAVVHSAKNGRMDDVLKIMSVIGESLDDTNIQTLSRAEDLLGGVDSAID